MRGEVAGLVVRSNLKKSKQGRLTYAVNRNYSAMKNKTINVVMAGSGALYPLYVGALMCFEDNGYNIKEIAGTSGGAISASIWSLCNVVKKKENMIELLIKTSPKNNKGMLKYSFLNFCTKWGLINGNKLEEMFDETFEPFLGQSSIPTHIFASTMNRDINVKFSSLHHPQAPTAKVVRASCSIPLVFEPTQIGNERYVDGGWLTHFPSNIFLNHEPINIGLRIGLSNESRVSKNLIEYIQYSMYRQVINHHKDNENKELDIIIDLNSNKNRMKLSSSKDEDIVDMFEEGYEQIQEKINNGQIAKKLPS